MTFSDLESLSAMYSVIQYEGGGYGWIQPCLGKSPSSAGIFPATGLQLWHSVRRCWCCDVASRRQSQIAWKRTHFTLMRAWINGWALEGCVPCWPPDDIAPTALAINIQLLQPIVWDALSASRLWYTRIQRLMQRLRNIGQNYGIAMSYTPSFKENVTFFIAQCYA